MYKNITTVLLAIFISNIQVISQNNYQTKLSIKGSYDELRILNIDISLEGKNIYSIKKVLEPHYSIPGTILLTNGNFALLHSLEGVLEIYDTSAKKIFNKEFYSLPPYNEQIIKYSINNLGVIFAVSEKQKNNIYFIENSKEVKFSFKVEDGLLAGIASTENGELLAYSVMQWDKDEILNKTIFLDIENKFLSEYTVNFEKGYFSNTNNLFLGITNNNSFFIDLEEGNILWQNNLANDQIYIDGMIEDNRAILVQTVKPNLVNNIWTYYKTKIIRKDLSGIEITLLEIAQPINKVKLIRSENKILINIDNNTSWLRTE